MNLRLCNYVPSSANEDEFFSKENIKRVSTPNPRPDATGLREAVVNNGPCPTTRTIRNSTSSSSSFIWGAS